MTTLPNAAGPELAARFSDPRTGIVANIDLSGVMRGRSFPVERLDQVLEGGLPWVPANILISPLGSLPAPSPFGPVGETRLKPDPGARMVLPRAGDRPPAILHLSDIETPDGEAWPVCPRFQLKRALADLEEEFGLRLKAGFEHEFYLRGLDTAPTPAFSPAGTRVVSGLAEDVFATLQTGGMRLEQFAAEFGEHQFEIASPPAGALAAADQAVFACEAIRDAARLRGLHATFAPKPGPGAPGSGVHVHFSLWDGAGAARTSRGGALTALAASFVSGVIAAMPAVLAFTAPSVNSYARIKPSSWVGAFACFGERNREAAVRLCPRSPDDAGNHPAASLEFRIADATANPYLVLAALARAGLDGLRARLPAPADVDCDPAALAPEARRAMGIETLPGSLPDVIARCDASGAGTRWFGALFWSAYRSARLNDISDAEKAGDAYAERLARAI